MFLSGSGSGSGSGVATGALTSWVFIACPDSFWVASISGVCNRADTALELVSVEAGPHPVAIITDTRIKVVTVYMQEVFFRVVCSRLDVRIVQHILSIKYQIKLVM